MAKLLKLRRGPTSQHSSFTGAEGECTVDTDKDTLVVHDNSTAGGRALLREDLNNLAAGAIVHAKLANDCIDGDNIANDAINSEHYAADSIDSEHYAPGSVDGTAIAADTIDSDHYKDGSIDEVHIADNQVTLAKMAGGTDGQIISYDANGDPVAIGPGTSGQVLTSGGAGSPPSFADAATGTSATDVTVAKGYEAPGTIPSNWSIGANNNAMFPGPMTVGSGVTITVPSNRTLTVV